MANPPTSPKGRVLLLEDDPALSEIIRDCLTENGYTVVAVQSGGEGVREVLASDFMMVFCDFMMPGLPGDMFYRAVEKIRPALCQGFIFMTGHQDDKRTLDFIQSVNGFVLRKPFPLRDLLDSMALAQVRRTYQSICQDIPPISEDARLFRPEDESPASGTPRPQASSIAKSHAPTRNSRPLRDPAPEAPPREVLPPSPAEVSPPRFSPAPATESSGLVQPPADTLAALEPPEKRRRPVYRKLFWLAPVLTLAAFAVGRHLELRAGAAAASADVLQRTQQWKTTSVHLREAEGKRSGFLLAVQRAKTITEEFRPPGVPQVLRSISTAAGANVEFDDIQVHGEPEAAASFRVRIAGITTGRDPRGTADRFRQALEVNMKHLFGKDPVATRFVRLEEVESSPGGAANELMRQAAFTIIATTGSAEFKVPEGNAPAQ